MTRATDCGDEIMTNLIEVQNLTKTYTMGDVEVQALRGISLTIAEGEMVAITGPSGSGKSTLLNIIGCLDQPSSGRFRFDGIDTTTLGEAERAGLRSRRIGFVFQSFHLLPYRTVLENVMLSEIYRGQPQEGRRERAIRAIDRVG